MFSRDSARGIACVYSITLAVVLAVGVRANDADALGPTTGVKTIADIKPPFTFRIKTVTPEGQPQPGVGIRCVYPRPERATPVVDTVTLSNSEGMATFVVHDANLITDRYFWFSVAAENFVGRGAVGISPIDRQFDWTFKVWPAAMHKVRIVDDEGRGIAGARVWLGAPDVFLDTTDSTSNDDGYLAVKVPHTTLGVVAVAPGYASTVRDNVQLADDTCTVTLSKGQDIPGQILDEENRLVPKMLVRARKGAAFPSDDALALTAMTNAAGGFRLKHASAGEWEISAVSADPNESYFAAPVTVIINEDRKVGLVTMQALQGFRIRGKYVTKYRTQVKRHGRRRLIWINTYSPVRISREERTQPDGTFDIAGIPCGTEGSIDFVGVSGFHSVVTLSHSHPFFVAQDRTLRFRNVPPGTYDGIEVRFLLAGRVEGAVKDARGRPLTDVEIVIDPPGYIERPDKKGEFTGTVAPLEPATITVRERRDQPDNTPVPRYERPQTLLVSEPFVVQEGEIVEKHLVVPVVERGGAASLVGKALPSMAAWAGDISTEVAAGKPVLVCFLDVQQRPSRNCLRQLTKEADRLNEKGVAVVVVQALEVDDETFKRWASPTGTHIRLSRIKESAEQVQSLWCVRSLPWLILTDAEHIVRAEGLPLNQLDAALEKLVTAPRPPSADAQLPAATQRRILRFPPERSMGTLYVTDPALLKTAQDSDWQRLGEARGNVAVPAGQAIRLDLREGAGRDLSPLAALGANDLQTLRCAGVQIPDEQLQHVAHLTGLHELDLCETNILGTGLRHLQGLNSLEKVYLAGTHVGDNELAHLAVLPSLRSLSLGETPTNDPGMVHVGKITSLETLALSAGITDEGLAHLENLTNLRRLSATNQGITDDGLAHLADMKQMQYLNLTNAQITDAGLVHLKRMARLKNLWLYGTRVSERGFAHLEGMHDLEELNVLFGVTDVGLQHLAKLPALRNVTVDGDSLSAQGLDLLSQMKSLEHLYVDNTPRMDQIAGMLSALPRLKKLTLGTGLTDEGAVQLQHIHTLEDLNIGPSRITGRGIAALGALPCLRSLKLNQITLASADEWTTFARLTSLRCLILRHVRSEVADAHIAHLAGLQSLRELDIDAVVIDDQGVSYATNITDRGLAHIVKLRKMETLSLRGTRITDEGLQQLAEIPTLRWLDLSGGNVTEQGLQRLKMRLAALDGHL
ncbi:MAG: hypothetical protein JW741_08725 [Sedimentisphaerales bacterium]|nr:hypothetical protein [Sedimentisphaerales bacterium]